ncbi:MULTISPECIES: geranylgeranyl diphosphate synthase [Metallosphaera]|uniref:geranylgeranyl diphosphate synthase n=1 Tax=Metallosphaera TaxID=41980 RepID=UPI001F06F6E2|nr:geranylgeranyl diphosphate synthase [Metallosphaera sedula]MCH1770590.1 polyprenyl synthetase family protein [Metallosphaera sedula]MCP6728788.1 polyprenyl synthetase family protein [Metallosphaera sedula]
MDLDQYFEEIVAKVNATMDSFLHGDTRELYEASRYLISAGGKRLRPLVVVLSSDLLGGERHRAILAGAAVEVLHNFTLIHDDIMDQDTTRRGIPTVHVKWGIPTAILAGDLLHAKAFQILTESIKGLSGDVAYKVLDCFSRSVIVVSEGQAMDMEFEKRWDIKEKDYLEMIRRKTAQLFACSAYLGGVLAGGNQEEVNNLYEFGEKMGIAFQIVDDILGITADEKELGKPLYSDIREAKKTLLVIKSLERANSEERKIIMEGLGSNDMSKLKATASLITGLSLDYAYELARKYHEEALAHLSRVTPRNENAVKGLRSIADIVIKRRK